MSAEKYPNRVGELRASQLMFNYGVGALVDLPRFAVLVQGLHRWRVRPHEQNKVIREPRLLALVQKWHPQVGQLLAPPVPEQTMSNDPFDPIHKVGVPVTTFPRWMVCPKCKKLAPYEPGALGNHFELKYSPTRPSETRLVHKTCSKMDKRPPQVVPARFLVACEHGHLDEFPWLTYVHQGEPCATPDLRLFEGGESGQVTELRVYCQSCKVHRAMSDAFDQNRNADIKLCTGRHPHLDVEGEECTAEVRAMSLGASNLWFPLSLSTISIPAAGREGDKLKRSLINKWPLFSAVASEGELAMLRKFNPEAGALIAGQGDTAVWQTIERIRREKAGETPPVSDSIRLPEWAVLSAADSGINDDDFEIEATAVSPSYASYIDKVVLVKRLREVRALLGFTRISTADDDTLEDVAMAPLSRQDLAWVPAHEVRGEGVFIQFREELIQQWLQREAVIQQDQAFLAAHLHWGKLRGLEGEAYEARYPGIRYVLLHTFAHVLMRAIALESGYALSSVRERIYAQEARDEEPAMAGVLIYTASADSEGTLGGLVNLGRGDLLEAFMDKAFDDAGFCSSDPLCAENKPSLAGRTIQGAACHACGLLPETSCERGNRYLDRAVLVPTLAERPGLAFFT